MLKTENSFYSPQSPSVQQNLTLLKENNESESFS